MSLSTVSTTVVLTTLLGASSTSLGQVVLMDQIGADDGSSIDAGNMVASQIFEAAYSIYDTAAIDDFEINAIQQVTSVSMVLVGWNGYNGLDGIQGLSANLYLSPEEAAVSLIGYANADVMGTPTGDPNWSGPDELVHVDVELFAYLGTAYVALIPINELGTNGQTGCHSSLLGNGNAWQANPGDGFGFGGLQSISENIAYRVMGLDPDCNSNGIPDYEEIEADPSLDCNANGWLDECEIEDGNDCNANGIVDACDIANGQSEDCNGNGVPDMCDIDNGSTQDCNNNLVPDVCDIADGTSQDLDGDGVPDECPLDCGAYFADTPLQQPDGNYEMIATHMDVGHGVVAITAQKVYPSGRRFHLHLYDSNSLELIADVPINADGAGVVATIGSQIAVAEDFIALSHIYSGDSPPVSIAERVNGNWMQTWSIQPPDEASGGFGYSVAAANNHIAVSGYGSAANPPVFLYHRDGTANWTLQQIIESPGGSSSLWGIALEMDGDWLAIADLLLTEIYMYRFDGTSYEYHSTVVQEVEGGDFGAHMSMDAGVLVCGNTQINNSSGGYVEVHRWNGDAWVFEAELGEGTNSDEQFGVSVSVQGNRVGVGATNYYGGGAESAGAYVFERRADGTWHEIVRVEDPDFDNVGMFGFSCGVTPDALLVGEPWPDLSSAHVYRISPSLDPDDCNSNGICDGLDIAAGGGTDCDGSGVLDQCEIDAGLVDDIDGNGIPDLCELDCDDDGWPDAYELASGSGFDCNANGQLDNCDIASGQSPDGDGDGVPDECNPDFVITVAADGSGMFSDLQAAIDLSIPGSRIEVQPGVYDGSIVFPGHDLDLVAVGTAEDTIIDAKGIGRVVFIGEGHSSATLLDGFTLQNGTAIQGGGILILRSTPTIRNCLIRDCIASFGGGVAIEDTPDGDARCVFYTSIIEDNFSTGYDFSFDSSGGAGMHCLDARVQLVECLINGNQAAQYDGGIQATDTGSPDNTTLTDLLLQQCEISGNVGSPAWGVLAMGTSTVVRVEDTLICGNASSNGVFPDHNYIDLGWNLFWDDCDDCNSNGIDDAQDILDGTVTDVDNDGIPDECETDCDGDGTPDPIEIYFGEADDVDGDGHPDNCEPDCNQNGIPDDFEIEQGWAEDCNDNLVPDDCDLEDPLVDCDGDGVLDVCQELDEESDCDGNGLIDACEILADPSLDCNGSDTLDSCDVDSGFSEDINGDGIPDECQCQADIDGSGSVDVNDVLLVISQWGLVDGSADVNEDGIVNVSDLLAVLSAWGPCS